MTKALDGRRIFIASPGGLSAERTIVREQTRLFNDMFAYPAGVAFITHGWEERPPGIGRPQELINELVDPCDFMFVLLGDKWGSNPGSAEGYTSGTEEEFMRAIELLADPNAAMRDVHVYFKSVSPEQMAEPDAELQRVLAFRQKLESSQELLFGTFDTGTSLIEKVQRSLNKWMQPLPLRTVRTIDLHGVPTSFSVEAGTHTELEAALRLADQGSLVQAEVLFAKASEGDSPAALSSFARFLRRTGRLLDALRVDERIVELHALQPNNPELADAAAFALANIGVIARKQGDPSRSEQALREAISIARSVPTSKQLGYALDNLGHTLSQMKRYNDAEECFLEALRARTAEGDTSRTVHSLCNLAWLDHRQGNSEPALQRFQEAERLARQSGDLTTLPNALTGQAASLRKLGRSIEAIPLLEEALRLNEAAGQSDGVGMVSGQLARTYVELDSLDDAERHASATARVAEESGNAVGASTAEWALALIARARGASDVADNHFQRALDLALEAHNEPLAHVIKTVWSSGPRAG